MITGNASGEFTLWNGTAFNFETILQAHEEAVRAMAWSHNDTWMVTGDHGGVVKYWQTSMTNVQAIQAHRYAKFHDSRYSKGACPLGDIFAHRLQVRNVF